MNLVGGLERALHGKVKPMITQCSIRHLYTLTVPQSEKDPLIVLAKTFERRRCNHHELENPLSTLECLSSVVDPKKSATNRNRYVVASQEEEVRRLCRGIKGVPLVYVKRSVMVLEPMAEGTIVVRNGMEREKFRTGLRGKVGKRKRDDEQEQYAGGSDQVEEGDANNDDKENKEKDEPEKKKKKTRGPKGPNPLSVKRAKREKIPVEDGGGDIPALMRGELGDESGTKTTIIEQLEGDQSPAEKRKRKRKRKSGKIDELRNDIAPDSRLET
ncbi:MAG: hypothetical protein Q9220_006809 [cf. Caloplaca sp. 1 TL-2023]